MRIHPGQAGFCLALVMASMAPAGAQQAGQDSALVSQKGFDCFVRHMGSYLTQGQEIVVNFENCPSQPGLRERMKAREATNMLPGVRPVTSPAGEAYRDLMILTPDMALCLRENAGVVRATRDRELVALFPEACLK